MWGGSIAVAQLSGEGQVSRLRILSTPRFICIEDTHPIPFPLMALKVANASLTGLSSFLEASVKYVSKRLNTGTKAWVQDWVHFISNANCTP